MRKLFAVLASAVLTLVATLVLSGTASADPVMTHNNPGMTHNNPEMTHN